MYNFWFAVEDQASLFSLKKGIERRELNAILFPVAPGQERPFPKLASVLTRAAHQGRADALFYESQRQPIPPAALTHKVPTLVSVDCTAPFNPTWVEVARRSLPAGFVVWSDWTRNQLTRELKIAPNRVLVARGGVDLASWDAGRKVFEQARAHKTGLPERVRLLFVGDDFVGLGGELLLDLLKHNPRLADNCELHLVVSRSAAASYLKPDLLPNFIQVHTYPQTRHIPPELYLNADICILPSLKPVTPALLAKAMAAGLPVIASRIGGLPELVQDGKSGILVEPGDRLGLVQALQSLIENPAKRFELGEGARQIAEAEFEASANANKILTFMKQITAEARSKAALAPATGFRQFAVASVGPEGHPYFEE